MSIATEHVSVEISGKTILSDVSLTVQLGELLAVVGPNGAGKSTLLKVLCGELEPSRGAVLIEDKPLGRWPKRQLAQRRAVLPQQSSLSFGFSVLEVVLLGRTPHLQGIESRRDYEIATDAMRLTNTEQFAKRVYTTLSGGERQRVQLARVLTQIWESDQQRYLMLDEPTNNLDLHYQHSMLALARRFADDGAGVLAILHDLNLAAQYADRILLLDKGRVVSVGPPEAVLTPERIRQTFNVDVMVQGHPCFDCPLVIPVPQVPHLDSQNPLTYEETHS